MADQSTTETKGRSRSREPRGSTIDLGTTTSLGTTTETAVTTGSLRGEAETTSPGGAFTTGVNDREGFGNNPSLGFDSTIGEDTASSMGEQQTNDTGFTSRFTSGFSERFTGTRDQVINRVRDMDLGARGRSAMTSIDTRTRANPWMAIGVAGILTFVIGYLFGRSFRNETEFSTAMGRGYEDFDDAIDE